MNHIDQTPLTQPQQYALRALARSGSLVPPWVNRDAYSELVDLGLADRWGSNVLVITDAGRAAAAALPESFMR